MSAKTQIQDIIIFVSGIDMSSAFYTIYRDELIKIAEEILDEDELRILSTLQAETTLEVRIENAQILSNLTLDHLKETALVVHFSHCT